MMMIKWLEAIHDYIIKLKRAEARIIELEAEIEQLAGMVEAQQRFIEKWGIGKTFAECQAEIEAERAALAGKE